MGAQLARELARTVEPGAHPQCVAGVRDELRPGLRRSTRAGSIFNTELLLSSRKEGAHQPPCRHRAKAAEGMSA